MANRNYFLLHLRVRTQNQNNENQI